jgi:flagellar basal body-associated protein FliL
VYTVLEGSLTFDVLVLSGKSQWTSISRWPNATSAQNEARKLVATKKHLGVKVSQETFDHDDNQFKEKTLFKHLKSDKKPSAQASESATGSASEFSVAGDDEFDEFDEFDDFDDYDDGTDWVVPVFGIFTALAVIVGMGIFFFDGKIDVGNNEKSEYFVFALPAVITNISSGGENFSVRIDLQLELDGAQDAKAVELALAQIMESAIIEIQETDAGDLQRSEKLQLLRAQLKQKIQDAMGETNLNGVLFNSIQVF